MANTIDLSGLATELLGDIKSAIRHDVIQTVEREFHDTALKAITSGKKQSTSSGSLYQRGNGIINALEIKDVKVGSSRAEFTIYMNPAKLEPYRNTYVGALNTYMGTRGEDFTSGILDVMNEGTKNHSPIYNHEGTRYFEKGYDYLEDNLLDIVGRAIAKKGWTVSY